MNHSIRTYKHSDFESISSWWAVSTGRMPIEGMMVENGTFVLELNNLPALCLTTLLTQSEQVSYVTAFVKNPIFSEVNLEEYGQMLWNHCFDFAKNNGAKKVLCFADVPQLKEKYKRFGMTPGLDNLTSFVREL